MVNDVTNHLLAHLPQFKEAIDALATLNKYFESRETKSAALGELSEVVMASYVGGKRRSPGTRGHDILAGHYLIEVKSRLIGQWKDALMFDFSKHSAEAHVAYCLAWDIGEDGRPIMQHAFELDIPFLLKTWGTPAQRNYSARTTLGKLKTAVSAISQSEMSVLQRNIKTA
ncbi:hypothetical protein [Bradyrhizobium sp. SZCCHNRI3043]|uniref:hypothetical protein n=1 Tax=Bradyrhizobium sp. SZCCHNRI3043 TaxID=3057292 RepID=UPI0028E22866|nr:hypothetical protein [Bradyrhizobium sp. SZCCHNRI3043]